MAFIKALQDPVFRAGRVTSRLTEHVPLVLSADTPFFWNLLMEYHIRAVPSDPAQILSNYPNYPSCCCGSRFKRKQPKPKHNPKPVLGGVCGLYRLSVWFGALGAKCFMSLTNMKKHWPGGSNYLKITRATLSSLRLCLVPRWSTLLIEQGTLKKFEYG